jgi:ribonuclease HI
MNATIYSDGASRGNPGDSAIAYIILDETGKVLKKHAAYVGKKTNNQAEYEALISALTAAAQTTNQTVTCKLDSELIVKQLNGQYHVKNPELKTLWQKTQQQNQKFRKVTFIHTARTNPHIQEVDHAANRILNKIAKKMRNPELSSKRQKNRDYPT